jgi:hypothetical protein
MELAETIGADGRRLLEAIYAKGVCPGYGNWTPSKPCGGCGFSTIMPTSTPPHGPRLAQRGS